MKKYVFRCLFLLLLVFGLSLNTGCSYFVDEEGRIVIVPETSNGNSNDDDNKKDDKLPPLDKGYYGDSTQSPEVEEEQEESTVPPPVEEEQEESTVPPPVEEEQEESTVPPSVNEDAPSSNPGEGSSANPPVEENVPSSNEKVKVSEKFKPGSITKEFTVLQTEHFRVEIDANVYVPAYTLEYLEVLYDTLEEISGLRFYNQHYNKGLITLEVAKVNNEKSPETELGSAYAHSKGAILHVGAGDLLLGNSYTIAHELSHILQYSQSSWHYSQVYVEGFAEYSSYKAIRYLEENNIDVAKAFVDTRSHINNMNIRGNIYEKTIQYWIENPKDACNISANCGYSVGFRFMSYLDDVYGDYSRWILYYENKDPYVIHKNVPQEVKLQEQYNAMILTYGEDVFDNFYAWLKVNENLFDTAFDVEKDVYDLTNLEYAYIYPHFYYSGNKTNFSRFYSFKYKDLYINIDEARNYLQNYKNKDVSNLKLVLAKKVKVELYDANDNLLEANFKNEFSLVGVSYIKLVGEGILGKGSTDGLQILY